MSQAVFDGLKVLFVGSIQLRHAGARYYATSQKFINGLIRQGACVTAISDRDMARLAGRFGMKSEPRTEAAFLELCQALRPDVILYSHADKIPPRTLQTVRAMLPATKQALLTIDALFVPGNVARLREKSGLVDAVFTTTWGPSRGKIAVSPTVPIYFMPNPVDRSIECHQAFANANPTHDIFFTCGNAPVGDERYDLPLFVQTQRPNYKMNWHMSSRDGGLWGAAYFQQVAAARCGLNLSRKLEKNKVIDPQDLQLYSSDRLAQYVGNGLLAFSDAAFGLEALFPAEEMPSFSTPEELLTQLDTYLADPAKTQRAAQAAWARAHNHYNAEAVTRFIVERTLGTSSFEPNWPSDGYQLD